MNKGQKENEEIDLLELLLIPLRQLIIAVIIAVVAGIAAYAYSVTMIPKKYQSQATIYIQNRANETQTTNSDLSAALSLTNDAKVVVLSRTVLDEVIDRLELEDVTAKQLEKRITVTNPTNTRFLNISVIDTDPLLAKDIADTLCEVSGERIVNIIGAEKVTINEYGNFPMKESSPNVMKNTLLGAIAGGVLMYALFVLLQFMDDKIYTSADVEKYLQLPVLGSIPKDNLEQ